MSDIVFKYYSGDLTLVAEAMKQHDALHGTTSTVQINTILGKRKFELDLCEQEARIRRMEQETLREAMEYLKPAEGASEVERIRAESDIQTIRAHYVKTMVGGAGSTPQLTDGRGTEISFALLEQKMGKRLNKQQRQRAGKRMVELMKRRYGEDHDFPTREEIVDGRVIQVKAYWSKDEDLMKNAIESVL